MKILYETESFSWGKEDEILYLNYKVNYVTNQIVEELLKAKLSIVGSSSYKTIIDSQTVENFEKGARNKLASIEGNKGISHCAVIIKSKVQVVLFNFFSIINKPKVPIKLFYDFHMAKEWIEKL